MALVILQIRLTTPCLACPHSMSEAVEGAELMLFCVSEKYKESANVRDYY